MRCGADDTVRIVRPARSRRIFVSLMVLALTGGLSVVLLAWLRPNPSSAIAIRTASEQEILQDRPLGLVVFRFSGNPDVLVLDFESLSAQGQMLNRVAALVEKAGMPRDRVLSDAEMDAAIHAAGYSPETYYYGHDYSASELARFFALAQRDGIALNPEEERLRALCAQEHWTTDTASGALISIPSTSADAAIDLAFRATILRHELSHGEFFTRPVYANAARAFWRDDMGSEDRALFRRFLAREGYDAANDDLVVNEMQAYLMHTRDPRFFSAVTLGMPQNHLEQLQAAFLVRIPPGWLRDSIPAPIKAASSQPSPRILRRGQRRSLVTRSRAPTAKRSWRSSASASAALSAGKYRSCGSESGRGVTKSGLEDAVAMIKSAP